MSDIDPKNIDFFKIARYLLMQSKLILAIVATAFILSILNYIYSTKYYKISSLLQVDSSQNTFDAAANFDFMSGGSQSDVTNLVKLYESRTNILKLIEDLDLNISVENISKNENLKIKIIRDTNLENYKKIFFIERIDDEFIIYDNDEKKIAQSKINKPFEIDNILFEINSLELNNSKKIKVIYKSPDLLFKKTKSLLTLQPITSRNSYFSKEGLIQVSYITDDVQKGIDIVNSANNIFLDYRVSVQTEKARKAIGYINENIESLKKVVDINKEQLNKYQEKIKSINVELEIKAVIEKIQAIDIQINNVDIEISNASKIYTKNNPVYSSLLNKKDVLIEQRSLILSEVEDMPKEQQEYIDLYNNLDISKSLYEELESRRLSFSIIEASTLGNIRIIDDAYKDSLESPKIISIISFSFIAFIIAILVAIIRGANFMPISNPAELFDNDITQPILGVLPYADDIENIRENNQFNSSLEALIVNIEALEDDKELSKIILITSPSPYNGKSTLARNLSESLVKANKKVLLIDNDLKRGKLARNYNLRGISESKFMNINEETIQEYKLDDSFYFIPRVKGLADSFRFLYSKAYRDKINFFKSQFDYIVFDSAPILSVADTPILASMTDITLLVVRHGYNKSNEIKQSIQSLNQVNTELDGIVYNAYAKPKSYYGYYGLYGNYSYQYYAEKYLENSYEYKKDV